MKKIVLAPVLSLLGAFVGMGCAVEGQGGDEAPSVQVDVDGIGEKTAVTSGSWTANAIMDVPSAPYEVSGYATLSGPAGSTTQFGVCFMRQNSSTPCTADADCSGISVPPGGSRHCVRPTGEANATCFVRPGPQANWCAGSPALGGAAIPPGTYSIGTIGTQANQNWIARGCFGFCTTSSTNQTVSYMATSYGGRF